MIYTSYFAKLKELENHNIIASTDYQKKIEEIANELVDYFINGI